jgi:hypothetical protein
LLIISFLNTLKCKCAKRKEIVTMLIMNKNKIFFISTISYLISRIILLAVLGLIISNLVLSITGIILVVVQLIISTLIIIGLIISLIQIIKNFIMIKTMTGKIRQVLFFQRVEVGVNP